MTLSKLERRRWIFLTLGVVFWGGFVYCIPSRLAFPLDALNLLLGLASPYFWYKALDLHFRPEYGPEDESTNAPAARRRTAIRLVCLVWGAASWGIFVYNLPPFSYRIPLPPNDPYQPLIPHDPVFRGILGFLSPFLWSTAAYLNIDNDSLWRAFLGTDSPGHEREPQPKKERNILGWALLICAQVVWVIFVDIIPSDLFGLWWELVRALIFNIPPSLLVFALLLNVKFLEMTRLPRATPSQ
jgi:hypothetical protein